jgi:hypothetical protein
MEKNQLYYGDNLEVLRGYILLVEVPLGGRGRFERGGDSSLRSE